MKRGQINALEKCGGMSFEKRQQHRIETQSDKESSLTIYYDTFFGRRNLIY